MKDKGIWLSCSVAQIHFHSNQKLAENHRRLHLRKQKFLKQNRFRITIVVEKRKVQISKENDENMEIKNKQTNKNFNITKVMIKLVRI